MALLALIAALAGCGGGTTGSGDNQSYVYIFHGGMVADLNADSSRVSATLLRDNLAYGLAVVSFDSDTLAFFNSAYRTSRAIGSLYSAGATSVRVVDSPDLNALFSQTVVDSFSITNVVPDRREKLSFETVQLEWSGSAGSGGYVIAAVKTSDVYTGKGFSQYVTEIGTSETFDNIAFTLDNLLNNQIDTGMYYLYVYSYSGAPDSALTAEYLPVPFPNKLADNINPGQAPFTGHFGTVSIALKDSMHVIAE